MAAHADFEFASSKMSRHGKLRWRFTKGDRPMLPGEPGEAEFLASYIALCEQHGLPCKQAPAKEERKPAQVIQLHGQDLDACWRLLRASKEWQREWSHQTKKTYGSLVEKMVDTKTEEGVLRYGSCGPVDKLRRKHVKHLLKQFEDRPYYQAQALQVLRHMFHEAMEAEDENGEAWLEHDPSAGMKIDLPTDSEGHPAFELEHLEAFEKYWVPGSKQRIAYALALWLGNRVSDVAGLDWSMLKTKTYMIAGEPRAVEVFEFVQFKGRKKKRGEKVTLPLSSMLARELQFITDRTGPVLTWGNGRRFTAGSLSNAFIRWTREAGIPVGYSMHGLRKALLTKVAEADATDRQLMAIAGWTSEEQVRIYIEKANKAKMAITAFDKLEEVEAAMRRPKLRVVK